MNLTRAVVSSKNGLRLIVGIDGSTGCEYVLELARRLDFLVPQHYVLVNVVEPAFPGGTSPPPMEVRPVASELKDREESGMARLKEFLPRIADRDPKAEELQAHGDPSTVLMRIAAEESADLVVIGRNRRNAFDDYVIGSVARDLLRECPQHVLVGRAPETLAESLNAVIVTDDSQDSERCIDAFLHLSPKGLEKVFVLAIDESDPGTAAMHSLGSPHGVDVSDQVTTDDLGSDARALCARLKRAGFDAEPLVMKGNSPADALSKALVSTRASLLVLAARPRGFWHRLLDGSVSETVFESNARSLLVLRSGPELK